MRRTLSTLPFLALSFLASGFLAGCATGVSESELASVSYGPRPPENWQQAVRDYLDPRIPDPKTAIITFRTEPKPFLQKETPMRDRQWGWASCVWVNENHPRGYPNTYPITFFFREGRIVHINGGPDDSNVVGAQYAREQCERLGSPLTVK